jgi:hypothetical protein
MTASIHETLTMNAANVRSLPAKDAEVTDLEKVRAARLTAAQQRRAAARTRDLTALLRDRPDLSGVHAPADFAVDALRWCV